MLGNFSFGDYFKHDAILYAWELLTTVYKLPQEKLWVTVYQEDDEAYNIWLNEIGVPAERIVRIGDNKGARYASDNFWQMADTGPCGPCTEIFYDHGPDVFGGPPGSPDEDGDRYIEIWNLVFMQFERDAQGVLNPLPKPCVDTGMGLERITAVMQHVHSNYEIDLFVHLIQAAGRETHTKDLENHSLKVIADHIRACSFLVVDGVIPSNEGRGYVLRRIIRRALRHGYKLGQTKPFFYKLVPDLVAQMGGAYPELAKASERVAQVLLQEEERFGETLENGMKILDVALAPLQKGQLLDGLTLFNLYDTYGFPVDLTADICRERGIDVDLAGFDVAMGHQKDQARAAGKFKAVSGLQFDGPTTEFTGYESLTGHAKVLGLYIDGTPVNQVNQNDTATVVLDVTPFYAESGGQVGDSGLLRGADFTFTVTDTQKIQHGVMGHLGVVSQGSITVGDTLECFVDNARRNRIIRHHSATHLLHKALREVLGSHVQQRGSLVDDEKTRFDFAHDAPLSVDDILRVENIVNAQVLTNVATQSQIMSFDDAIKGGAMALFGEKYGDDVRVLDIGFSRELCGGVHVSRTGDVGLLKIVGEMGVASGVRRIEAVAGDVALEWVQNLNAQMNKVAHLMRCPASELNDRIMALQEQNKGLEKQLDQSRAKLATDIAASLAGQATVFEAGDFKLLAVRVEGIESKALRSLVDQLKDRLKSCIVILAAVDQDKVALAAGVSADLVKQYSAGKLVDFVAKQIGGKGGGRPDMAMGGGTDVAGLAQALAGVPNWVQQQAL
jgi:alanyl-tRNA synthetase